MAAAQVRVEPPRAAGPSAAAVRGVSGLTTSLVVAVLTVLVALLVLADLTVLPSGLRLDGLVRRRPDAWLALLVATWAAGLVLWARAEGRRRPAAGLALAGAAVVLPVAATSQATPLWSLPLLAAASWGLAAGVSLVVAGWDDERIGRHSAIAAAGLLVAAAMLTAVSHDPWSEPTCTVRCPFALEPWAAGLLTHRQGTAAASVLGLAAVVACAGVVLRARTAPAPVRRFALVALGLTASVAPVSLTGGRSVASVSVRVVLLLAAATLLAGITVQAGRTVRARRRLRRLVTRLDHGVAADEADALLDLRGDGGEATRGWDAADWLVVENARLAAASRAAQREVAESRRRIVARGDEELRRIAGDLHDGAQQRLVSAKLFLAVARASAAPEDAPRLATAEQRLADVLSGLRALTHGVYPRLVDPEGLAPALADLVAHTDVPVRLRTLDLPADLARQAALAAYHLVADAVERADPAAGVVEVTVSGDAAELRVLVEGIGIADSEPSPEVLDRVATLGGSARAVDGRLRAVVPCG